MGLLGFVLVVGGLGGLWGACGFCGTDHLDIDVVPELGSKSI